MVSARYLYQCMHATSSPYSALYHAPVGDSSALGAKKGDETDWKWTGYVCTGKWFCRIFICSTHKKVLVSTW